MTTATVEKPGSFEKIQSVGEFLQQIFEKFDIKYDDLKTRARRMASKVVTDEQLQKLFDTVKLGIDNGKKIYETGEIEFGEHKFDVTKLASLLDILPDREFTYRGIKISTKDIKGMLKKWAESRKGGQSSADGDYNI